MLSVFFLRDKSPDPARLIEGLMRRYMNRSLIVHEGFAPNWFEELLKLPGGAGHFRIDVRTPWGRRASPVQWFVHTQILPLALPLPVFVLLKPEGIYVRHLTRGGASVHPSELLWFIDEIEARHHALLKVCDAGFAVTRGIDVRDNEAEAIYGL